MKGRGWRRGRRSDRRKEPPGPEAMDGVSVRWPRTQIPNPSRRPESSAARRSTSGPSMTGASASPPGRRLPEHAMSCSPRYCCRTFSGGGGCAGVLHRRGISILPGDALLAAGRGTSSSGLPCCLQSYEGYRQEHDQKVGLLRKQEVKGVDYLKLEKNKMDIESLKSKMLVATQSIEITTTEIIRLRESKLFPQLLELIAGLVQSSFHHHSSSSASDFQLDEHVARHVRVSSSSDTSCSSSSKVRHCAWACGCVGVEANASGRRRGGKRRQKTKPSGGRRGNLLT